MKKTDTQKFVIRFVESVIVVIYIIFEELIWNIFAEPLFRLFKKLVPLEALTTTFLTMNRYLLLVTFVVCLAVAEAIGLLSGISFLNGQVFFGVVIYTLKIPTAAFTFWLFDLTKQQLFTFQWLKNSYDLTMKLIDLIVNSSVHVYIKSKILSVRAKLTELSIKYFGKEGFIASVKQHYHVFKDYYRKYR